MGPEHWPLFSIFIRKLVSVSVNQLHWYNTLKISLSGTTTTSNIIMGIYFILSK